MAAESDEIVSVVGNASGQQVNGNAGPSSGQHIPNSKSSDSVQNSTAKDTNSNGETSLDHQEKNPRSVQEVNRNVNGNKFRGNAPAYFSDVLDHHRAAILGDNDHDDDGLGPLPYKWEKAYTESGEVYFIDHNTGTSHWLDPRLSKFQKKSLEDCLDDELPYGWEKIDDPQYGTYFIDHVNRRTQYENPVLEAKRRLERSRPSGSKGPVFTRNPLELRGERITTTLLKSSRGLGFTIVGGDDNVDEFLQIKSIVPNGPAWLDGKLQTGDVLVYVNDICVLGFTHHDMVNVFQSILPGETVPLEVCRGYPLPFDPNDPNTEVVTTIAVDGINSDPEKARILMDLNMDGNYNFLDMSDPVSPGAIGGQSVKNPLARLQGGGEDFFTNSKVENEPEIHHISIVKGAMGFGFTIADSAYGQKVKKILDRQCCKDLQEGDILLAINSIGVKQMSHNEVVQVLKDCPKSQEAILKVQRGFHPKDKGLLGLDRKGLKKSEGIFRFGKDGNLYRSKTPTADLYSTQPKEILPTRPKTPLVDTRARAKTPSNDLNTDDNQATGAGAIEKVTEKEGIPADSKSNTSFADHDSINNDIPYIDPFPKVVMALTDRLADANLNPNSHDKYQQDRLHSASKTFASSQSDLNNYDHINTDFYMNTPVSNFGSVAPPPMVPLMAPIPTYHQDTCYCFECQDFNRQQMEYIQQQQRNLFNWQHVNGRTNRKVNDYLMDRRRAGFSPLETHPGGGGGYQQQSAMSSWKYGQPSPAEGGFFQAPIQDEYSLSEVTLERQTLGFGFRIVGGTEEGSQVTVGHIVPGGSADRDPRIATGDEILSIDGVNVVNASHHRVVQLMGEAALRGQVVMILRRKNLTKHKIYPYDVIVSRNENEGFGFVIISSTSQYYGSTIGKLIPGSPADRCGELKVGDRIVAVNRIDIAGMSHGDVVNLIKESGLHVRLTIGCPQVLTTNNQPLKPPSAKNDAFYPDSRYPTLANHPQL